MPIGVRHLPWRCVDRVASPMRYRVFDFFNSPTAPLGPELGGRPKELLAGEFLGDVMGVVDLHQGFHDSVDVHRDGARHVVLEHEVVVQ